jgi:multidrug transporter EmrE-like cation transporter
LTGAALGLVVAAAVLHASWNAFAKRAQDQLVFLWMSLSLATLLLVPWAAWVAAVQGVSRSALPFTMATIAIHAVYFWTLSRAYRAGAFSHVYPIARGLGVALVPILAAPVLEEHVSVGGAIGVGLVILGVVARHWLTAHSPPEPTSSGSPGDSPGSRTRQDGVGDEPRGRHGGPEVNGGFELPVEVPRNADLGSAGTGWAVLTGLSVAAYSLVDKAGVARLHPVPYITALGLGTSLLLLPVAVARWPAVATEWRENRRAVLLSATMNLTAYLLVLFAFRLSKAGYVVAARELSIVFSTIIGSVWLNEGRLGGGLTSAGLILIGVACIAMAG